MVISFGGKRQMVLIVLKGVRIRKHSADVSLTGSFTQYCDLSRQYDPIPSPNTTTGKPDGKPVPAWKGAPISSFVEPFGKFDLLAYMNK
jgi:hypothetical protein